MSSENGTSDKSNTGNVVNITEASVDKAAQKFRGDLKWLWWLAGTLATVLALGFGVREYLGNFVSQSDLADAASADEREHEGMSERVDRIVDRLQEIQIDQARQAERTRLIDRRLELLLVRSSRSINSNRRRDRNSPREEELGLDIDRMQRDLDQIDRR